MEADDNEQSNVITMTSASSTPTTTPTTISIVIPLSGALSMLPPPSCITAERSSIINNECANGELTNKKICETAGGSTKNGETTMMVAAEQQLVQSRPDKNKGCPFPTCSRYGRAFSRAHDLKRHIARHESRKEKLVETNRGDIRMCCQCGESFLNDTILERHARSAHLVSAGGSIKQQPAHRQQHEHEFRPLVTFMPALSMLSSGHQQSSSPATGESCRPVIAYYSCNICQKKCTNENKLKAHRLSSCLTTENNHQKPEDKVCQFNHDEKVIQTTHTKELERATSLSQIVQESFNGGAKSKSQPAKEEKVNDNDDKVDVDGDDDDDNDNDEFMLEEMLQLNKNTKIIHRSSLSNNRRILNAASAPISLASFPSLSSSSSSTTVTTTKNNNNNNNNNDNKIRCDYCSKTFKTKWTLSSHVAAHEGRFQFVCTRCGKKFVRKSHFEGHVRSHEAARPYVCEQCGKTFKELKHRREHTKRKHPDNQNAIQNLLDSISACVSEDSSVDQAKFTLLMPMNFGA